MKIKKIPEIPNEHYPETQSVLGLNFMPGGTSASRKQMNANNLGQLVVVAGMTERSIQTGLERRYAKTTFSVKMPANGKILAIIPRYNNLREGVDTIKVNPQTVVIYEDEHTREVGMINLTDYCSYHPYIGFNYVQKPGMDELRTGANIKGGTVFLDSPGVTDNNDYMFGVECNVCFMSHPATSEDGILMNRDALKKFAFKTYETRIVEFGANEFPLNIGTDPDKYKAHPEIGEYIPDNGRLMVLRTYDPALAVVEQSVTATMEPQFFFDKCVYVNGGGGKVIDIRVHHDPSNSQSGTAPTMEAQSMKYDVARREFYTAIHNLDNQLQRRPGPPVVLSKELHRLMVEAISVVGPNDQKVQKVNKRVPLNDWRIEFVIEYTNIPNIGNKYTDDFGGKGVTCHTAPKEHMPVDEHGNIADFVFDPGSTANRMIPARLYEQYIKSASRDVLRHIVKMLGVNQDQRKSKLNEELSRLQTNNPDLFNQAWAYLMKYYTMLVPRQAKVYIDGLYGSTPLSHLVHIIHARMIVLHIRSDHELEFKNMIADLEEHFPPLFGPVKYVGFSGKQVTTKKKIRIGPMHILMLEKIADSWSAVASARLQHFGVLATLSNADKYSQPIRNQPTRAFGESEIRILASYAGTLITAEIMDRNNNLAAHKEIVRNIFRANKPTDIDVAVDRTIVPLGGSKPLQLVKHMAQCGGWNFAYKPYQPLWTPPNTVQ